MLRLEEFMELFKLKQAGYTITDISRITGRDRKTVRKYLSRGKSTPPAMSPRKARESKLKRFEPDILNLLKYSDTSFPPCTAIYERLVRLGYTGSLSLVQKWMRKFRAQHFPKVVIRYETPPGEQAQVDWGEKRMLDLKTGLRKKVYIFAMTLSWSRMRFYQFFPKADMYHFLLGHKLAFQYFGGMPREILYDQNRCVLIKAGFKDVTFNRRFLDFAYHYDFMPKVCKPRRPQTKGKVENSIKYIKKNFLSLQETPDMAALNPRAKAWFKRINQKVHSTIQEIPCKRLPKEGLSPVWEVPDYDLYYVEPRKIFSDSTFSFQGKRYSVPPHYIGKFILVKYRPNLQRIDVYFREQPITQHRTDTDEQYVIKRAHKHMIWQVWRGDHKRFCRHAEEKKPFNHPLSVYEEATAGEGAHESATA